jgi:uncharacterized protein (UPF0332 family)
VDVNPLLFWKQAQRLLSSVAEEDWRTATSRAYYAAFHLACSFMTNLGFTVPKAERAHAYLWLRLQNCGDAVVQQAGSILNYLRQQRNWADYDLHRSFPLARAVADVQDAKTMIDTLDAVVEPARTQILNAVKDYERLVLQEITWHP